MLSPIEIHGGGGKFLIGPLAMLPPRRRAAAPPLGAVQRLFGDRAAVAQLRRAWPRLPAGGDHHQQLTPPEMRHLLERAFETHLLAILWIPPFSDAPILVSAERLPEPPKPPLPGAAAVPGAPAVKPVPPPIASLSAEEKIGIALGRSLDHLARDARDSVAALRKALSELDAAAVAKFAAFFVVLATPVVGEAAMLGLLGYFCYRLGVDAAQGLLKLGEASFEAANARSDQDIDAAARLFAQAFASLGTAFVDGLLARLQFQILRSSRGGATTGRQEARGSGGAATEAAAARKIAQDPAESYASQVLKKHKDAVVQAKEAAEKVVAEEMKALPPAVTEKLLDAADEAYAAIRASTTDVAAIAEHTGFKPSSIQKVKDHMFYEEHLLDRYVALGEPAEFRRFDSDLALAEAWKRLELGTHTAEDIQLLKHEIAEAWYMRNIAPGYSAAHDAAQARFPAPGY